MLISSDLLTTRKYLKSRLRASYTKFEGHEVEWKEIRDLLFRTWSLEESNSALIIGFRGCGKTTLVRSILESFKSDKSFGKNAIVVELNGLVHTDDNLAIESITTQLDVDSGEGSGKVFNSFAENLLYLLDCLKCGDRNKSKSVLFILEEFDLFCSHHNQTLLYNLFDIAQSAQAPICVLGTTRRLDVIELLEKRVKSRFSHRQFFLLPNSDLDSRIELFKNLLLLDEKSSKLPKKWCDDWNRGINKLTESKTVQSLLQRHINYESSIASLKMLLFQLVSDLSDDQYPTITVENLQKLIDRYENDSRVDQICDLSVLEVCLIIAMKHHCEIYDRDPFNFELIFARFNKFARTSGIFQNIGREVVMKAFERIQQLEFIAPVSTNASNSILKQFQMHYLVVTFPQINAAISKYQELPTDVDQWSKSCLI